MAKEDLQRASKSIDGIQLGEGVTKEKFFARMDEFKVQTKQKKEILWKQTPQNLEEFYTQAEPYSFCELDALVTNLQLNFDVKSPPKLPPVLVWIVEDAIFGWNRATLQQTSNTVAGATKKIDELAFQFANKHLYYRQLDMFSPKSLTELQAHLPKEDEIEIKTYFNDAFYADWKEARETHTLSSFAARQCNKPSSLVDRAKRYQKVCNILSSIDVFTDSRFSLNDKEILKTVLHDLDRKTNGYIETMRKFLQSCSNNSIHQVTNVFVTRRNLVLTASMFMMLGLNKSIEPSAIFHVQQAKEMQEFMDKRIYRIFGPHRRVAVLISREHKPPLNRNPNLKVVDVYSEKELASFLTLLINKAP